MPLSWTMRDWNGRTAPGITVRVLHDAIAACRVHSIYDAHEMSSFAFEAVSVLCPEAIGWREFANGQARYWLLRQAVVTRLDMAMSCEVLDQMAVSLEALRARLRQHLDDKAAVAELEKQLSKEG